MSITTAHLRSSAFIIDPVYSIEDKLPADVSIGDWLYHQGEYEAFLLARMIRVTQEAKLHVGYPGCFRVPVSAVSYRRDVGKGSINIGICGAATAFFNGKPLALTRLVSGKYRIDCPEEGMLLLQVCNDDLPYSIPALESGLDGWYASIDGVGFTQAKRGKEPTGEMLPEVGLIPKEYSPGYYDAGRELLARVEIHAQQKPIIGLGESKYEAQNTDPSISEQSLELVEIRPGVWQTPCALAFRYIQVIGENVAKVVCRAIYAPLAYTGAFAADAELSEIWMKSAYTLRLCMHHFIIDGVKRDRLPWVGDLVVSMLANAYTFGEAEIVRRTLVALGSAGIREKHLNGIVDYSLWYIIAHDYFQRYFGQHDFLRENYSLIKDIIAVLQEQANDKHYLPEGEWLFIDWVECPKNTALQILYYWALKSAEKLALRMDDPVYAEALSADARGLRENIIKDAYDPVSGCFLSVPAQESSGHTRYPLVFAILSGLADTEMKTLIAVNLKGNELARVGTPYQAALEIMALHRTGFSDEAVARIRKIWGGMLGQDATTFFEDYDEGVARYDFYGRPYAKSLCHAWSAGPAALLPMIFFNLEPLSDGWETYQFEPLPNCSVNIAATVPVPDGYLCVENVGGAWNVQKIIHE